VSERAGPTQTSYLVGGGPGTLLAMRRHLRVALAEIGRPRPLIAYVGVASHDNAGFFTMVRAGLALGSARMRMARIAAPRAAASEARALLEESDLVFVSGGDVYHGMRVLRDKDMVAPLQALARAGKPMFGISAGSIMLGREWVRFGGDDEDASSAELFPCLGIVPLHVDAHSEDDDWAELRILLQLLLERGDRGVVGYGLTRKGALRVAVQASGAKASALGTPIPRLVWRGGKVVHGDPLAPA
jgi:peptidase E